MHLANNIYGELEYKRCNTKGNIILSRKVTNCNFTSTECPATENGKRKDLKNLLSKQNPQKLALKTEKSVKFFDAMQYDKPGPPIK